MGEAPQTLARCTAAGLEVLGAGCAITTILLKARLTAVTLLSMVWCCRPPTQNETVATCVHQVVNASESTNEVSVVQSVAGKPVHRTYKCFDKV